VSSTDDQATYPVEPLVLGRMLAVLVRYEGRKGRFVNGKWTHTGPWRGYPFDWKEVEAVFGRSKRELRKIRQQYLDTHPWWTADKVTSGLIAFLQKYKRWPRTREWRNANGLPSRTTMERTQDMVYVLRRVIEHPKYKLPPYLILTVPNVTLRKAAIDLAGGFDEVMKLLLVENPGSVKKVAEDKYGTIWWLPGETNQEPMSILEVVNSTREKDGSYAHHFLRIPPNIRVPQQAVAWSFGVRENWRQFEMAQET